MIILFYTVKLTGFLIIPGYGVLTAANSPISSVLHNPQPYTHSNRKPYSASAEIFCFAGRNGWAVACSCQSTILVAIRIVRISAVASLVLLCHPSKCTTVLHCGLTTVKINDRKPIL
jgi:hypothetical protein